MFIITEAGKTAPPAIPAIKAKPNFGPVVIAASAHIISKQLVINELMEILKEHPKIIINTPCPLSELQTKDDGCEVVVYLNLPFEFKGVFGYTPALHDVLRKNIETLYDKGVPDEVWATKAVNMVLKTQTISIEKWLMTYTNASDTMKDNEIRDMASLIKASRCLYELVICESPADYVEMFKVNTRSCMQRHPNSGYYGNSTYQTDIWDKGIAIGCHPASWYHFTKTSKGCYLRNKKTEEIVARAMLYKDAAGVWSKYGDMKAPTNGARSAMQRHLSDLGIAGDAGYWTLNEPFVVPGFLIDDTYCCPMPYGDYVRAQMQIRYDPDTHEYHFTPSNYDISLYTFKGYIRPCDVPKLEKKAA